MYCSLPSKQSSKRVKICAKKPQKTVQKTQSIEPLKEADKRKEVPVPVKTDVVDKNVLLFLYIFFY